MKFVTGIPKELAPKPAAAPCNDNFGGRRREVRRRHVRRGAGLSPSTERHSASQATSGSKQSGHAVDGGAARAAISWASLHHGTAGEVVQTSATRHVVARLSPSRSTSVARQRGVSSRRAASQRRGSGDHTSGRKCMCDCAGGAVLKKIAAHAACEGHRCGERQRRRPAAGPCSGWRRAVERARSKAEPSRQARRPAPQARVHAAVARCPSSTCQPACEPLREWIVSLASSDCSQLRLTARERR